MVLGFSSPNDLRTLPLTVDSVNLGHSVHLEIIKKLISSKLLYIFLIHNFSQDTFELLIIRDLALRNKKKKKKNRYVGLFFLTKWHNLPFSPTNGKDHVKTSIKLGNQYGCGEQLNCLIFITLFSYFNTAACGQ